MFATRVFSFFAVVFLALAGMANAVPAKRQADASDVQAVLTDLQSSTSPILSQISTLVDNDQDTDDTVEPLVDQLADAFDAAQSSLNGLQRRGLITRQTNDEVARTAADVISNTATTFDKVKGHGKVTKFPLLTIKIDLQLQGLLITLGGLLQGVLTLVAGLLVDVAGLLNGLGLTLLVTLLGL